MADPRPLEFVEIAHRAIASSEKFEVQLDNGRRIIVPPSFDADALVRLMSIVGATR
jgi:hypothetical protein